MELTEQQQLIMSAKVCAYCKKPTEYVDSKIIYAKSYGMIYLCTGCGAYVGVHKGTDKALGRVAKDELRQLKKQAHEYFDKIWRLKLMSRNNAYQWLSDTLGIPLQYTHIGMFSEETCKKVVYHSKQLLNDMRRLDLDFGDEPKTEYYELNN